MSDVTKKKISENNKKFSICKICDKQCRGFRGLVDHMHKDHEDYKPWKCHMCSVRTAFVKTLYRHIKQEHGTGGSPCPVCGKVFTRAQSMLHHVNKVHRLTLDISYVNISFQHNSQLVPEDVRCQDCGERVPADLQRCLHCTAQYSRHNDFSIPPQDQEYNFLLFTETDLSITDAGLDLGLPQLNPDQKLFDDTQTGNFVDPTVFDKTFLVEDVSPLNNSRINQISEGCPREIPTSGNHHLIDGTVIRFCKNSI